MKPSQQAGIRCQDPEFKRWLKEKRGFLCNNPEEIANFVRDYCMVTSRSQLDTNLDAQRIWFKLDQDFREEFGKVAEQR